MQNSALHPVHLQKELMFVIENIILVFPFFVNPYIDTNTKKQYTKNQRHKEVVL